MREVNEEEHISLHYTCHVICTVRRKKRSTWFLGALFHFNLDFVTQRQDDNNSVTHLLVSVKVSSVVSKI